jgi:hypothetical protein
MAVTHWSAPEVKAIAEKLIAQYHRDLAYSGVRIEYVFRSEASRSGGKLTLGTARKVQGLNALLAHEEKLRDPAESSEDLAFFVIEIAHDTYELLEHKAQVALIDHELSHCAIDQDDDGNTKLVLRPHDVEDFGAIFRRHGAWRPDMDRLLRSIGSDVLSLWAQQVAGDPDPAGVLADL